MRINQIPHNGWIYGLSEGDPFIEDHVHNNIHLATNITELKQDIISQMTNLIAECTNVIQNANAMKVPKECTYGTRCDER